MSYTYLYSEEVSLSKLKHQFDCLFFLFILWQGCKNFPKI